MPESPSRLQGFRAGWSAMSGVLYWLRLLAGGVCLPLVFPYIVYKLYRMHWGSLKTGCLQDKVVLITGASSGLGEEKAQEALRIHGHIDILVNSGGISYRGEAADTSVEVDVKLMMVNYFGHVALTKAMDETTATGMAPEDVADIVLEAVVNKRADVVISSFIPRLVLFVRVLFPWLYFAIMKGRAKRLRLQQRRVQ
ncbi:hypothetical protein V5799_033778 [Amblyomma americanum]|uniref:Hydroxysteroid 17-beta dehydrogenase 11 n=1 Tax=Amblyomma americanum TaxID=6943 RepID=A0AAQ4DMC8_AMBAM